ncbi:DUF4382 domain-containing protein [Halolamina rubra]|uniref:DUF4382 domain-containing protein n=1 Tax=Halolamina rubra TaxID=1380430 RepID=UPI0006792CCA|nr:DUF4382 domain-containing protein [Halolamina rubra]
MRRQTIVTALVVAMVAIAGCGGSVSPGDGGGGEGTVNMYVSDQPSAIDDFEHLNVTVTSIAAHRVDGSGNESEWVEQEIDNVTVDLTELRGANASQLGAIPAPNGSYDKTFIHVSEVNGTLTNGESTDVKLPSEKLHINENFTVGNGEEVDFVFDITVVKRGQSGSYNIQPVASESGTDQEIREKPGAKRGAGGDGANGGDDDATATPPGTETETPAGTATATPSDGAASLEFYVSDERNAIDEFDHLNVTIDRVGVHRADPGANESAWIEHSVDNRTVDLTELRGANATSLGVLNVSNGTYDKTFVYVDEVNGTLTNGEHPDVKLPSSKLQLNSEFTVGDGEQLDYVFDITVVKRGNSGSYNVKPVASESGTGEQVEIEERDDEEAGTNETETEEPAALSLSLDGNATAGENVTVSVTRNGSAVDGAAVSVDGEVVGETDENGTLVVSVPADAEELELEAERGDAEGEATFPVQEDTSTETETATETAALAAPAFAAL